MISSRDIGEEQRAKIRLWAERGATLGEIQKQLGEELEVHVTFLEARMLLSDLGIALQDKEKAPENTERGDTLRGNAEGVLDSETAGAEPAAASPGAPGNVSVTMEAVVQPGLIANGGVTFGDGMRATWYLDQFGRLGLDPDTPGYRPSKADITAFQQELERLAQAEGL